jgi:hypothetical protein
VYLVLSRVEGQIANVKGCWGRQLLLQVRLWALKI